jgi:hypothetical protein
MKLNVLMATATLALAIAGSASARVFDFSYTTADGPSGVETATGVVTVSNTEVDGHFDITSITGTADGSTITGLSPYADSDNLLYAPPASAVSFGGVSFTTQSAGDFNVFFQNGGYFVISSLFDSGGNAGSGSQIIQGSFSAVPETATWLLMIAGIGGVGLALRGARGSADKRTVGSLAV